MYHVSHVFIYVVFAIFVFLLLSLFHILPVAVNSFIRSSIAALVVDWNHNKSLHAV